MSTIWIEEFDKFPRDKNGVGGSMAPVPIANQKITISTESDSATFNAATLWIRIHSDAACYYAIGTSPTATQSTSHLPSGVPVDIFVGENSGFKLSQVAVS